MASNIVPHPNLLDNFRLRSKLLFCIEQYFQAQDYIALHTPAMASRIIPEQYIDVFELAITKQDTPAATIELETTELVTTESASNRGAPTEIPREQPSNKHEPDKHNPNNRTKNQKRYLLPSPELGIKTLLAMLGNPKHAMQDTVPPNVYEIAHSFRNSEQVDALHNSEFMMLEWYSHNAKLQDSMHTCTELVRHCAKSIDGLLVLASPLVLSVEDAFAKFANINLIDLINCSNAQDAATYAGLDLPAQSSYQWVDVFHHILVERVESQLPLDRLVYLIHYPARIATLAKSMDGVWAERYELYINGVEIANCYVEECDPVHIAAYMDFQQQQINTNIYPREASVAHAKEFLQQLPLPPYSGVALGLDRLMMCLLRMQGHTITALSDVSPLAWLQELNN